MNPCDLVRAQFTCTPTETTCEHDPVSEGVVSCRKCAMVLGAVFVVGFPRHNGPLYIYNRVTRFAVVLSKLGVEDERMFDVFDGVETVWKKDPTIFKRRYFLNLKFCAWHIGLIFDIDLEKSHGPCIKDRARVVAQTVIFKTLLKSYNTDHYEAYCSKSSILSDTTSEAPEINDCCTA